MNAARPPRRFLFLLASSRREGNTETLARLAATHLPSTAEQVWLRLSELVISPGADLRHDSIGGAGPHPVDDDGRLLSATLDATDIVFCAPLYWYSLPASAKLYLDHWSGWLRLPGVDFRNRMAGKIMWAVCVLSDSDRSVAHPLFATLKLTADYMQMQWGGDLLGRANRPGDVRDDDEACARATTLFSSVSGFGAPD